MKTDCYIGRKPCGCIAAVVLDNPEHPKRVAKDVAGFIRQGLKVEPGVAKDIRAHLFRCPHEAKARTKRVTASPLFKGATNAQA